MDCACEPRLFNLPKQAIRSAVETAINEPIESYSIVGDQEIIGFRGYAAEKVMPLIEYTARSGKTGRLTIFGKRMYGPDYYRRASVRVSRSPRFSNAAAIRIRTRS